MAQQYFDYNYISTVAGSTIATILITEYIKDLPILKKVPTKVVVLCIALFVIVTTEIVTHRFSAINIFLYILNALLVASSAIGSWETIAKNETPLLEDMQIADEAQEDITELRVEIQNALQQLTPLQKKIIEEVIVKDRKEKDVALELGVTRQAINKAKKSAIIKLKSYLTEVPEK